MKLFIPLSTIDDNPFQGRRHYDPDATERLADSIERTGVIHDPTARIVDADGAAVPGATDLGPGTLADLLRDAPAYASGVIAALFLPTADGGRGWRVQSAVGHRRRRAMAVVWERQHARAGDLVAGAGVLGLVGVPVGTMAVDVRVLSEQAMADQEQDENDQRRDLSAVEVAEAWQTRVDRLGMTHEEIGERYGFSRPAVSNKIRLLKLPEEVRQMNRDGRLSEVQARALVPLWSLEGEAETVAAGLPGSEHAGDARTELAHVACEMASATEVEHAARELLAYVEGEVERGRRAREPEMFDASADGSLTADEATAEVAAVRKAWVSADPWRHQPSDVERVSRKDLDRSAVRLAEVGCRLAVVEAQDARRAVLGDDARRLAERLRSSIDHDLATYRAEQDRRDAGDGYDDGGRQLAAAAEARGMEPFDAAPAEAAPPQPTTTPAKVKATPDAHEAWPAPALPPVYHDLDGMTKAQLMEVESKHDLSLTHPRNVAGVYNGIGTSNRKSEILAWVKARLVNEANLAAAMALTDDQVDEIEPFIKAVVNHSEEAVGLGMARRTLDVVEFSPQAAETFRRAHVRRALATCYRGVLNRVRAAKKAERVGAPKPDGINQREHKLLGALHQAGAAGYEPRRSDEAAAAHLVELGLAAVAGGLHYATEYVPSGRGVREGPVSGIIDSTHVDAGDLLHLAGGDVSRVGQMSTATLRTWGRRPEEDQDPATADAVGAELARRAVPSGDGADVPAETPVAGVSQ